MSKKLTIPLVGGLFAGIAASLCCVAPLLLLLLGFSGAWMSHLTMLEPYRPIFIAIALMALAMVYVQLYKPSVHQCCAAEKLCAKPPTQRLYKNLFWGVVVVVIIAIASPYLMVFIYG